MRWFCIFTNIHISQDIFLRQINVKTFQRKFVLLRLTYMRYQVHVQYRGR